MSSVHNKLDLDEIYDLEYFQYKYRHILSTNRWCCSILQFFFSTYNRKTLRVKYKIVALVALKMYWPIRYQIKLFNHNSMSQIVTSIFVFQLFRGINRIVNIIIFLPVDYVYHFRSFYYRTQSFGLQISLRFRTRFSRLTINPL